MSDRPLLNDPGQTPVPHRNGGSNLPARQPYMEVPPPVVLNGEAPALVLEYWYMLRRRKGTLVLFACLGLLAGGLLTLPQTPVYQARTTLEIQNLNENFLNMRDVNPTTNEGGGQPSESDLQTQISILQSESVIKQVIADLDLSGQFSHLVGTWDGTTLRLYVNGVFNAQSAPGASPVDSGCPFFIGGFYAVNDGSCNYVGQFFNGLIDEVSYFNRALSGAEIQSIYNAGSAGKCHIPIITSQPHSQVGYWGKSVILTVTTAGTAPLSYQWLQNGTPIQGATGSSLVLTNLQLTNAGDYSVVVTNAYGSATSSNAYLTVNPAGVSLALYSGITIDGVVGLTYGIQYSTDLSNTNGWRGMANLTLGTPTELWFDVQPASQPQRYYRVLPGPISRSEERCRERA